jgi:shikimate dehydrogenase
MRYGLLGEVLGHSFSKSIHNTLGDYPYDLIEVKKDELDAFMRAKDFAGLNVTIPYKESVIPYLDHIDEAAKAIGAVNTIVNRDGKLYGYNTDFYGMARLIYHAKISLAGMKVIILGTGGTSKTAMAVAKSLGAREILIVSRSCGEDVITYEELYESHTDADVLINTTPVGMFPNSDNFPVEIGRFSSLVGVIDAVYNPLRTPLIVEAKKRKIKAEGGLYMLVAQAVRASEIFLNTQYDERTVDKLWRRMIREKENIVLIGMPASGKSTVGRILE